MSETTTSVQSDADSPIATEEIGTGAASGQADGALVQDELLVEEISIDGMCGVY